MFSMEAHYCALDNLQGGVVEVAPNARVLYCFIETTPPHSMCIIPSTAMSLRIMSDVFDGCVHV